MGINENNFFSNDRNFKNYSNLKVKNVSKITCPVRQYASKKEGGFFSKMINRVTGSKKKEESELTEEESEAQVRETHVQADLEEIEREEEENRKQQIEKARLKSRLFYSD